jgi:SAM-dependent methyltransferase
MASTVPRDELISRAKVVLNIHFYEPGGFEAVRVFYLLANRKAVVTEINPGEFLDRDLSEGVLAVPYGGLVEACKSLLGDSSRRRDLEECGFHAIAARDEAVILREALAPLSTITAAERPVTTPRRLNLGSGRDWRPDYLNVDLNAAWKPDVVADICDPDLFYREFPCSRFGTTRLQYDYFDEIVALDVLEHIPDLSRAMTNCLSLLREGGIMRIHVPYDLSFGAWQDPTHVRAFNERSWWYYCQWFWYLGWTTARFDLVRLEYGFSPLGAEMKARGSNDEDIARTPRAVDQMRVLLRKRPVAPEEQAEGRRLRGDNRPDMA